MISKVMICFILLCAFSTLNFAMASSLSKEEDLNIEKELLSLNKPPVKTFQLEGGEIIDCIDFYKQPAFDHPLLKNHSVQMAPKAYLGRGKNSSITEKQFQTHSTHKSCPIGTVPIQRTTKEDLLKAKELGVAMPNAGILSSAHMVFVSMYKNTATKYRGARGIASLYNLSMVKGQSSTANIWIEGGPDEQLNYIVAGWAVSPKMYGDNNPHLFIYWSADGGRSTGCFNMLCKGFVQVHRDIKLGQVLLPVSKYGGPTYDFKVMIYQDKDTRNWVLSVYQEEIVVGYLPNELLPFMKDGASSVAWGGIANAGSDGKTPPMGSGYRPDGRSDHAAYFKFINYYDEHFSKKVPSYYDSYEHVDPSHCFGFQNMDKQPWRENFLYGGPGGDCGN